MFKERELTEAEITFSGSPGAIEEFMAKFRAKAARNAGWQVERGFQY